MDCEMCGREEAEARVAVEGTTLSLCGGCSRYGKTVGRIAVAATAARKREEKHAVPEDDTEAAVANFGQLLKRKREELGRKQEDGFMKLEDFARMISVKESVLHKMETGEYLPGVEEAKRIGRLLRLKLVEKAESQEGSVPPARKDQLTLGDMIRIKKKR